MAVRLPYLAHLYNLSLCHCNILAIIIPIRKPADLGTSCPPYQSFPCFQSFGTPSASRTKFTPSFLHLTGLATELLHLYRFHPLANNITLGFDDTLPHSPRLSKRLTSPKLSTWSTTPNSSPHSCFTTKATIPNARAPSFRPTCFRLIHFVQSY